jgi:hypothetical protein
LLFIKDPPKNKKPDRRPVYGSIGHKNAKKS